MSDTARLRSIMYSQLALPSRLGHALLLVVAMLATLVCTILLFTEPDLPLRTRVAFGVGIGIGASWSTFAVWVLSRRHVLYARHHVIAARLAIAVSTIVLVGSAMLAQTTQGAHAIVWSAIVMLLIAIAVHQRAQRRVAQLELRRAELTHALMQSAPRTERSS